MARLYDDLLKATGQRYYYALDAVPGIVTPQVGTITLFGRTATMTEPATLSIIPVTGLISLVPLAATSPGQLVPAPVSILVQARAVTLETNITLYPTLPSPIEAAEPSYAPSLITEMTVSPGVGQISVQARQPGVSEGGNIAFVSPAQGIITISGLVPVFVYQPEVGTITCIGHAPTLTANSIGTVEPDVGVIFLSGEAPEVSVPFGWVDDEPAQTTTWIDDV